MRPEQRGPAIVRTIAVFLIAGFLVDIANDRSRGPFPRRMPGRRLGPDDHGGRACGGTTPFPGGCGVLGLVHGRS